MSAAGEPYYPKQTGEFKIGDFIIMGEKTPCKIINYSISKTGKHGHAKANFTAIGIFDGKRFEGAEPTTHNSNAPNVENINVFMQSYDDTHIYWMAESGDSGDTAIPDFPAGYGEKIKADFELTQKSEGLVQLTVCRSMGVEQIMSHRIDTSK